MKTIFALAASLVLSAPALAADLAGCLPQLEKSLCYGPAIAHWTSNQDDLMGGLRRYQDRACAPVPATVKETLTSVYHQYPREIQQAFCEIKKLFVVTGDVPYGAVAEYYFDLKTVKIRHGEWNPHFTGKPVGYIMEISEKNRFKGETSEQYFTRVFRARFGNAANAVEQLPAARYQDPFGTNGALATTIVHELGHLLGRAQKVTSTYFLPFSEGAWSKITFRLDQDSYSLRNAPWEYSNSMGLKQLSLNDVKPTFDLFRKSGVATLYGATSPQEDFAEFFMLYYYGDLQWNVAGKTVFDLQQELSSTPAFKAKKDIIRKLMALPAPFSLKNRGTVSGEIGSM